MSQERHYEVILIYPPVFAGEKLNEAIRNFQDLAGKFGGKVAAHQDMGKRAIGFRIKKNSEGNYVHVDLNLNPAQVSELKKVLTLNEDILRYSIFLKPVITRVSTYKKPATPPQHSATSSAKG